MDIKTWLSSLRAAAETLRRALLIRLFRSSSPRRRDIAPVEVGDFGASADEADNDVLVIREKRAIRLVCSEPLRLSLRYREWIAPLAGLKRGAGAADIERAIHRLTGFRGEGQTFFPVEDHWKTMPYSSAERVHYCLGAKKPALEFPLAVLRSQTASNVADDESVLVIHSFPTP